MMRREIPAGAVVAGVDGSAQGLDGARFAAREARRARARLEIVSVVPGYLPVGPFPLVPEETLHGYALHALDAAVVAAHEEVPPLAVGRHLLTGRRVDELVRVSAEALEIVLAGRSLDRLDRMLVGATVPGVASRATCPVVVVPPHRKPRPLSYRRIVVGLKTLDDAGEVIDDAFSRAEQLGAELVVLHAWRFGGRYDELVAGSADEVRWGTDLVAELEMHLAGPRDRHPQVDARVRIVHARPVVALVDASCEADRLLISRPAHGARVHHLGGVGRAVLRTASCPVEVRAPGQKKGCAA